MIKDYFRLAYKNTKQRKLRSWLTMIGIFIGIAAVVALIALSEGMQVAIQEQFSQLGSDKLIVQSAESSFGPPGTGVTHPLTKDDKKVVEQVKGVKVSVGRLLRSVEIKFNDQVKFAYAATVPDNNNLDEWDLVYEANDNEIEFGRLLKRGDNYKILVGYSFYENFFKKPVNVRDKLTIEGQKFEVVGVLKKRGNPLQDSAIVIPEQALKEVLGIGDEYDLIALQVNDENEISVVEDRLKDDLRKQRNVEEGKEDFSIQTPGSIVETLTTILSIVQGVLVGIAAISLLVGAIGIMNTMYTAVLERTREIGIMKATGAQGNQISWLFLIESGFLGFFGGFIGVVLGIIISKTVEFVAFQIFGSFLIKAELAPSLIIGALFFSFLVGSLSGLLPARQAAKLTPVEAFRE